MSSEEEQEFLRLKQQYPPIEEEYVFQKGLEKLILRTQLEKEWANLLEEHPSMGVSASAKSDYHQAPTSGTPPFYQRWGLVAIGIILVLVGYLLWPMQEDQPKFAAHSPNENHLDLFIGIPQNLRSASPLTLDSPEIQKSLATYSPALQALIIAYRAQEMDALPRLLEQISPQDEDLALGQLITAIAHLQQQHYPEALEILLQVKDSFYQGHTAWLKGLAYKMTEQPEKAKAAYLEAAASERLGTEQRERATQEANLLPPKN